MTNRTYKAHYSKKKYDLKGLKKRFKEKGYDSILFPNGELWDLEEE